jgi:predicted DCC family thiol-disulfide oxidoreductase YuxK
MQPQHNMFSTLTIYFDEKCPLCLAEIILLKQHNHKGLLDFISLQKIDLSCDDINCELAFKNIHARLGDHQIIVGPEVFFEAYKRTDLRVINFLFSLKIFRFIYSRFYFLFAKYRHQISKVIGPFLLACVRRRYPES